ncbi:MAG: hypothetical protein A2Z20_09245 [Bdellovibrionales bacterium RBG_16_40_8]|nr:MAG: hypothetical protein A2Z20_09245 [Bdellovibrionales bacterium RBG_16_40_8]
MSFDFAPVSDILFVILSVLSVFFAVLTVYTPHILRSASYLMGVLSLTAGLYILLGAELLAGVQLLVYVGGIVVLLVISIMLTVNDNKSVQYEASFLRKAFALLASGGFYISFSYFLSKSSFATNSFYLNPVENANTAGASAIKGVGLALLSSGPNGFILPFEVISLLLLTVLVSGIVIARKDTP